MDYIYQELLRQRAALARLLLGSGKEREERHTSAGAAALPAVRLEAGGGWKSARYGGPQVVRGPGVSAAFTEGQAGGGGFDASLADDREAVFGTGGVPAGETPAAREDGCRSGEGTAVLMRQWPLSDAGGKGAEQALWLRLETGERSGEKALSRAVQRDARRYDGGFSLY